ncbi:unannotated protein [freshwater metagenome]|uniref:Unannotated protein n=1 Tax=freshwater metagenome TaxID=449393 RepID=A0A6J7DFH0_9ZZZZ
MHCPDHGKATDELGDQTELEEVLGEDLGKHLARVLVELGHHRCVEPDTAAPDALLDDLLKTGKCPTADEQHVGGVDLEEFLVRVLAPALRGDRGNRSLEDLEEGLLHTLTGNVSRDRRVFALTGDLVDLVNVDDPGLGLLDVVVGGLDELQQNVLDILAHVAGLGERRGVRYSERHVEQPGQCLCEVGLAAARRPEQQDVGLLQFHIVTTADGAARLELDPLVVVVDGHREDLLRGDLTDYVLIKEVGDLPGRGEFLEMRFRCIGELFFDDLVAEIDALVADIHAGAGDELLDLLLRLPAERTLQQLARIAELRQRSPSVRLVSGWDQYGPQPAVSRSRYR